MAKILVCLFLLFNFAFFDSCAEETKPDKSTISENKTKPDKAPETKTESNKNQETSSPEKNPTNIPIAEATKTPTEPPQPIETANNKNKKNKNKTSETTPTPKITPTPKTTPASKATPTPKVTPAPKATPTPKVTPIPKMETTTDQSTTVYKSIDILLGRKPASTEEKNTALKTVKNVLSVKEFKNARSKRNDPNLLKDRYPKSKEIKVGSKNQIVFWNAYDRMHFAARHLIDFFDTTDVKGKNSWWPAGTTQEQIDRYLEMTLEANKAKITLPDVGKTGQDFKYFDFDLQDKNKLRVSIGIQSDGRVTSFFPKTGTNVISLSESDIQKLLTAVGK